MRYNAIALVGPTSVGKTDAAIRIAGSHDGCLICCDILQFYRGFEIGSGMPADRELEGIPRRLYGYLSPKSPYLSSEDYHRLASEARREIASRSLNAIFEGCTTRYIRVLTCTPPASELGDVVVFGLFPISPAGVLDSHLRKRLDRLFELGVVNEIEDLLDAGYRSTSPMKDGVVYSCLLPYVLGRVSYRQAVEATVVRWKMTFYSQLRSIQDVPGITPIETDLANPFTTFEKLERLIV